MAARLDILAELAGGGAGPSSWRQPALAAGKPLEPSHRHLLPVGLAALAAGAGAALLLGRALPPRASPAGGAGQGLAAGAAILALAVALDSAVEHYRGGFANRAMFVAPTVAAATLAAASFRLFDAKLPASGVILAAAVATGGAGTAFHLYDVGKRVDGFGLADLFYAAPLGAPAALALAGLYGLASGQDARFARPLALVVAVALAGTSAEAGLLHFRGAFQNPFMYAPVTVPPAAAAAVAAAALIPSMLPAARLLLRATAALGLAGPIFHAYGIHRAMGGWRNWRQNLVDGPPLPAPPAFTGIALAGLGLLPLLEERAG